MRQFLLLKTITMRNTIYICLSAIILNSCGIAESLISTPYSNAMVKNSNGTEMLLGHCTRSCLAQKPFADWYFKNYEDYKIDSSVIKETDRLMKNKNMTIFMGTWCGDSRREVPRVLKMLDCCNFPMQNLQLVMVGNADSLYKKSPQHEEAGKNIVRVPTIIVEQNGKEIGRIIEFPVSSLEKDMLSILRRENYVPNYNGIKAEAR